MIHEQDIPSVCPICDTYMDMRDISEVGDYPQGGYRSMMKPNQTKAFIYECPKCYARSCHHVNEDMVNTFRRFKEL